MTGPAFSPASTQDCTFALLILRIGVPRLLAPRAPHVVAPWLFANKPKPGATALGSLFPCTSKKFGCFGSNQAGLPLAVPSDGMFFCSRNPTAPTDTLLSERMMDTLSC